MELWQVKNVTEFLALTKIQLLFRNKCPSGCCKTLFNIQSSEKLDFNSFCHFFVVKEKHIFGDPYFAFFFFFADVYCPHLFLYWFICVENHEFIEILPTSVQHQRINSSVLHL